MLPSRYYETHSGLMYPNSIHHGP